MNCAKRLLSEKPCSLSFVAATTVKTCHVGLGTVTLGLGSGGLIPAGRSAVRVGRPGPVRRRSDSESTPDSERTQSGLVTTGRVATRRAGGFKLVNEKDTELSAAFTVTSLVD